MRHTPYKYTHTNTEHRAADAGGAVCGARAVIVLQNLESDRDVVRLDHAR